MEPGALDEAPAPAASALVFAVLQAVEQALPEYRSSALGRLARSEETEGDGPATYKSEQNRRWCKDNPHGADVIAAATKAADAARERTARYLLATSLEQLRERAVPGPRRPRPRRGRSGFPGLAARPLDGEAAGVLIA